MGWVIDVLRFIGRLVFGMFVGFVLLLAAAFFWGVATTWFDRRVRRGGRDV